MSRKTCRGRARSTHTHRSPPSPSEANLTGATPTHTIRTETTPYNAIPLKVTPTEPISTEPTAEHAPGPRDTPAAVFHYYSKLPLELRTMILRILIDEPRTINVLQAGPPNKAMLASPVVNFRKPICQLENKQTPALLHSSKDTRDIALRFYRVVSPAFLTTPFYYNDAVDTLSLSSVGIAVAMATRWADIPKMRISTLAINMSRTPDLEFVEPLLLEMKERDYR
ncbi:hypothetical protein DL98DRAFT_591929 [Cadophora sp. DSE1049]|nr:hypothetical protein DL98DRAFT_591929 [Cadophora sp. DSE1049]